MKKIIYYLVNNTHGHKETPIITRHLTPDTNRQYTLDSRHLAIINKQQRIDKILNTRLD